MSKYYGIDVGGTTVKLGLFSEDSLLEKWEIPTDTSSGGHIHGFKMPETPAVTLPEASVSQG